MSSQNRVHVELIRVHPSVKMPEYKTTGAAAVDMQAYLPDGAVTIAPGETVAISSGLRMHVSNTNYAMLLLPRSGLGSKGIVLANTVGLIDSDYQGETVMMVHNRSKEPFVVNNGDRIAQAMFLPVAMALFCEVEQFSETTERGTGGFGSTGTAG